MYNYSISPMNVSAIITTLLDAVFPPTKREQRIRTLYQKNNHELPPADDPIHAFIHAATSYRNQDVRNIVQAAKYDNSQVATKLIGKVLYDHLLSICEQKRIFSNSIMLVPIPMSKKRKHKRNGNHSCSITKSIIDYDSSNLLRFAPVLTKVKKTPPQTSLSKEKRLQNLSGAFKAKSSFSLTNKTIILIDDVTTTGATFQEARKKLKPDNPEHILALAFAH